MIDLGSRDTADPARLDLDAYLARVGYSGPLAPTRAVLEALHLAHATRIPFENLDTMPPHDVQCPRV